MKRHLDVTEWVPRGGGQRGHFFWSTWMQVGHRCTPLSLWLQLPECVCTCVHLDLLGFVCFKSWKKYSRCRTRWQYLCCRCMMKFWNSAVLFMHFVTRECFHNHLTLFTNQLLSLMAALRAPENQACWRGSDFWRQPTGERVHKRDCHYSLWLSSVRLFICWVFLQRPISLVMVVIEYI